MVMLWDRNSFYAILASYTYLRNCRDFQMRQVYLVEMVGKMINLLPVQEKLLSAEDRWDTRVEILRLLDGAVNQAMALLPEKHNEKLVGVLTEDLCVAVFFFPEELLQKYFRKIPRLIGAPDFDVIESLADQYLREKSNQNLDLSSFYSIDEELQPVAVKSN